MNEEAGPLARPVSRAPETHLPCRGLPLGLGVAGQPGSHAGPQRAPTCPQNSVFVVPSRRGARASLGSGQGRGRGHTGARAASDTLLA